jgi:NADPH:quinone reductase-like Zn-dependent oxidoreductase
MDQQTGKVIKEMRAVFTNPESSSRLILQNTPVPAPLSNQALVKVNTFSLNQGETRTALAASTSYIPGWDFAGVIERPASDGSSPKKGARVFGYAPGGSWAEYLAIAGGLMAETPAEISDSVAACLPIAGVTALACMEATGNMFNRRILITGAAGGVGIFACQLAFGAGAKVFAVSRRQRLAGHLLEKKVSLSGVFGTIEEACAAGNYDIIWDSIGGNTLATAITALARNGCCINYGNSSREPTTINVRNSQWPFHAIRCIWLGREPEYNSTPILQRLAELVKSELIHPYIDVELPWTNVIEATEKLVKREVDGKIVLKVVL